MTEAKERIGKRYRILKSRWKVPSGTTGIVIRAKQECTGGQPWSGKGKMPERTAADVVWILDIECDNTRKTIISVDEQDESIEEIGGPTRRTPAKRLGCKDDEEAA